MELSFTRIGLLMKKQFMEDKKLYLFGVLAMMGIMSIIFLATIASRDGFQIESQGVFFGVGLISFGCLFTLTLFSKLDRSKETIQLFTLPASMLEKLICAIVYGVFLFPLVYLITIYPLLRLANVLDVAYMGHINKAYSFNLNILHVVFLTIFYVLQALVLLLSVTFKEYKIVKSIVLICSLAFGSIFLYPRIVSQFLPTSFIKPIALKVKTFEENRLKSIQMLKVTETFTNRDSHSPYSEGRYFSNSRHASLQVPFNQKVWFYILLYLSVPVMWFITWLRLKEWEVN